jgi:hypothetical protein
MRKLILKWYVIYMIKRMSFEEKIREKYERLIK